MTAFAASSSPAAALVLVRRDSSRGAFPDARIRMESGSGVPSGDA